MDARDIVIVNGTGSHRVNTDAELAAMVGESVFDPLPRGEPRLARSGTRWRHAGTGIDGLPVHMNREYVEADRRIVLGFIEPHFMAGFSGGYKGVFPAVAEIGAIMRYHDAATIGHPKSTWGVLDGNPTQARIRHDGALLPVDFCVNVTLNRDRAITRFFCGEVSRRTTQAVRSRARPRWSRASGRSRSWSRPTAATRSTRTSTRP